MPVVADPQVLAFAVVAAVLTITPGADTMLVLRNVIARGRGAGLMTTLGICTGVFVHAALSALGLSVILVRSATAFEVVKLLGAVYLVYLGAQSIRAAMRTPPGGAAAEHRRERLRWRRHSALQGFLTNILNPKVAVFYVAFLPQFINPGDWVLAKSLLLAGIHWMEGIVWLTALSLFVGRMRGWITDGRVRRAIEATSGGIMIAFGVRLAVERTR
jgi:RhtB (resistance to homoserine/threonine) family protein